MSSLTITPLHSNRSPLLWQRATPSADLASISPDGTVLFLAKGPALTAHAVDGGQTHELRLDATIVAIFAVDEETVLLFTGPETARLVRRSAKGLSIEATRRMPVPRGLVALPKNRRVAVLFGRTIALLNPATLDEVRRMPIEVESDSAVLGACSHDEEQLLFWGKSSTGINAGVPSCMPGVIELFALNLADETTIRLGTLASPTDEEPGDPVAVRHCGTYAVASTIDVDGNVRFRKFDMPAAADAEAVAEWVAPPIEDASLAQNLATYWEVDATTGTLLLAGAQGRLETAKLDGASGTVAWGASSGGQASAVRRTDDGRVLTWGEGEIAAWDVARAVGRHPLEYLGVGKCIRLRFSPCGRWGLVATRSTFRYYSGDSGDYYHCAGGLCWVDLETGVPVAKLFGGFSYADFSPGGRYVVAVDEETGFVQLDVETGRRVNSEDRATYSTHSVNDPVVNGIVPITTNVKYDHWKDDDSGPRYWTVDLNAIDPLQGEPALPSSTELRVDIEGALLVVRDARGSVRGEYRGEVAFVAVQMSERNHRILALDEDGRFQVISVHRSEASA